ncbi:tubulin polyglutamylase TTLL11 isoform X8 [Mauremys mutica]|uniref:tubulin polyglutamylase TTLL11 isoform X8 n=1 Tax=Mauremys mutica TaxID=74926 RepID=UPI001D16C898|nr:tubulin polyglutamylase TTLL11 isoform X8 [Mauremys mutica]
MESAGTEPESCPPAPEPPGSPALPAEEPERSEAAPEPQQEAEGVPPPAQGRRPSGPGSKGQAKRCGAGKGGRAKRGSTRRAGEEGGRLARRAHVTVDSSKAKTSLEALKLSLRQLRWREFPFGRRLPCDIYWHGVSFHDNDIFSGQVNKFPGMTEMVRKITLSRAVRTMQDLFPEEYNFYPHSWILPEEFPLFVAEVRMMKESDPPWKPTFIVKPDGGCQGDGIYLIKDPSDIRLAGNLQSRPAVVQEYISKPLLIDKLKFDIRLYVLLKSLEPLEIYIAKDGLSRFCTEPYQEPTLKNLHQILGFDILLMKNLKPVLLEVNANPSMRIEHEQELSPGVFENVPSPVDEEIKVAVIRDTLRLMDPYKKKKKDNQLPDTCMDSKQRFPPISSRLPQSNLQFSKFAIVRSQLSENAADTKDELLEPGSTDQLEHISKNPEASLPSLCLKQVFPKYAKQFNYLRLVDRMAALFIRFLGVKGTMKLGPTGFRTFIRNCKLSNSNFSMASVDILYIDITRRWNSMGLDQRESGMCLQAFVEAFFCLAQRRYKSLSLQEQVASLIDFCEYHLAILDEKRLVCSRGITERRAALVTCQPDGLHLTAATHAPLLNRMTAANKRTDYRNHRS